MSTTDTQISRFLSLVLRHRPEAIGLALDAHGWADVDELIQKAAEHGRAISPETLARVVETNDKRRFTLDDARGRIRANQGHSVAVDLDLEARVPPAHLFHGTARRFLPAIEREGLVRGHRHHVHLSADRATALQVGKRHGKPAVLVVEARALHDAGRPFFRSANGVWLCDRIPASSLLLDGRRLAG
jgi:putative RNA 2'-phosphotransferase